MGMQVDRSFGITVREETGGMDREWKYLSSGTVDQAYFSLRLAISSLLAEGETIPIFLDDVFAQYDDGRARRGLQFLQSFAAEKGCQIFLFSCHRHLLRLAEEEGAGVSRTLHPESSR